MENPQCWGHLELRREGMPSWGAARGPGVGGGAAGPELQILKAGCLAGACLWNKQPTTLFKTEKLDHLIFIIPGRGSPTLEAAGAGKGQWQGPGPGSSNPCPWQRCVAGVLSYDSFPRSS